MEPRKIKIEDLYDPFSAYTYKTYSVDEVLAAGGTTAFAVKMGKNPENIEKALEALPPEAFLTDEEFEAALAILKESK